MDFPINKALLELYSVIPTHLLGVQDNRNGQYLHIHIGDEAIHISCRDRSGKQLKIQCSGSGRVAASCDGRYASFSLPSHDTFAFTPISETKEAFTQMLRNEFDFDIHCVELDRIYCKLI